MSDIINRIKNDHYKYLEQKELGMNKYGKSKAVADVVAKTSSAWLPTLIKTLGWAVGVPGSILSTTWGIKKMFSDTGKSEPPPHAQQGQGIDGQSILGLAGIAGGIYLLNKYIDKKEKKNKISDDSLNRVESLMAQKKRKKRKENEILKMYDNEIV